MPMRWRISSSTFVSGADALALAALVARYEPGLSAEQHRIAEALLNGGASVRYPAGTKFDIAAEKIDCRVGDVAIASRSCDLTFGADTHSLTGGLANEPYATLVVAGVAPDGAAGATHEALHDLSCELEPRAILDNAGGGAKCAFTSGH